MLRHHPRLLGGLLLTAALVVSGGWARENSVAGQTISRSVREPVLNRT